MIANQRARPQRVRTGCRQCRVRRRKCDEGKPRCRNCISKDSPCQYGPRLTFLSKNAYTVQQSVQHVDSSRARGEYEAIQFVDASPSQSSKDGQAAISLRGSGSRGSEVLPPKTTGVLSSQSHAKHGNDDNQTETGDRNMQLGTCMSTSMSMSPTEGHTSAVQGLLALGATTFNAEEPSVIHSGNYATTSHDVKSTPIDETLNRGIPLSQTWTGNTPSEPSLSATFQHNTESPLNRTSLHESQSFLSPRSTINSSPAASRMRQQEHGNLHALQHYRYEVATWLDICDTNQSFGIAATQLALGAAPFGPDPDADVLSAMLSLGGTSPGVMDESSPLQSINNEKPPASLSENRVETTMDSTSAADEHRNVVSSALSLCLRRVKYSVENIHYTWTETETSVHDSDLIDSLGRYASQEGLESAIFWLLLRLDLSTALINPTPSLLELLIKLPLHNLEPETTDSIFHYAHIPLVLCAQAILFCNENQRHNGSPSTEAWTQVTHNLDQWYSNRPSHFLPMLDADDDNSNNFPIILFTNGAAIFANQLYHTAMFLLLRKKPRTAQVLHIQNSSAKSVLWHTRRICGIALQNDRRQCWDLTLVSSLFLAARSITYRNQQASVMRGFDEIRQITGWELGGVVEALRAEWATMEESP